MSLTGIASARQKLKRALHHIDDLDSAIASYQEDGACTYKMVVVKESTSTDRDVKCHAIVTDVKEVPEEWPLIAGDALTNLRAALDHSVYGLIRQFPTAKTQPVDRKTKLPKQVDPIPGYPQATAVMVAAQPYESADPHMHELGILFELVNEDKHRKILIANGCKLDLALRFAGDFEIQEQPIPSLYNSELSVGSVIGIYTLHPTTPDATRAKIDYVTKPVFTSVIDIPGTENPENPGTPNHDDVVQVLRRLHTFVSKLIDDLDAAGLP
ncbi:hypothetical protein ACWEOI_14935 [Nocardia sp. NPDC004340]